jgi:ADP-heptose:LPS heptosyltransferase
MNSTGYPLPGIRKIAFLRANGLGDFVFALPALQSLRAAYPQAEIVLLGKSWHERFLKDRAGTVDRIIVIPTSTGVNEHAYWELPELAHPTRLSDFFLKMQAEQFDLAIQAHGGGRNSNPFLLKLEARTTVGMKTPDAPELDHWMPYRYWQHEVLRLLELVSLVGAAAITTEPVLQLTQADQTEADAFLSHLDDPLVVLHPAATDPRRRWPAKKFAAVGDAVVNAGFRVAITGAQPEADVVSEVIDYMNSPVENLCGRISINGLAGVMARASIVVANDSGPLHLAEAVGAATVSIYWCGNLINAGPFNRTRNRPLLSWRLLCPICGTNTMHAGCDHTASFVDDVSVDEVLAEVLDLIQLTQKVRD